MWELEWGDKIEFLENRVESGLSAPALDSQVDLPQYALFYMDAFTRLSRSRIVNELGPQSIQLSEIVAYLNLFPWYDTEEFVSVMTKMDIAYLERIT